jgi:hypothetical protein
MTMNILNAFQHKWIICFIFVSMSWCDNRNSMDSSDVTVHVVRLRKLLMANMTLKWRFFGVSSHMRFELRSTVRDATTYRTAFVCCVFQIRRGFGWS